MTCSTSRRSLMPQNNLWLTFHSLRLATRESCVINKVHNSHRGPLCIYNNLTSQITDALVDHTKNLPHPECLPSKATNARCKLRVWTMANTNLQWILKSKSISAQKHLTRSFKSLSLANTTRHLEKQRKCVMLALTETKLTFSSTNILKVQTGQSTKVKTLLADSVSRGKKFTSGTGTGKREIDQGRVAVDKTFKLEIELLTSKTST